MTFIVRSDSSLWQWTLQRVNEHRQAVLLLVGLSGAEVAFRVATPWALKAAVDYVFAGRPAPAWLQAIAVRSVASWGDSPRVSLLVTIAGLGLAAHLAHHTVMWMHTRLYSALAQTLTRELRTDLFWHLQCLRLAHHTKYAAADAVYRLAADATCIEQLVFRAAIPGLASLVTLVAMFLVLLGIHPWLAVVSLAVIPGLWLSLRLHSRRVRGEAARVKALESRAIEHAQESLSVIRLVKTFARERHEHGRFSTAAEQATRARLELTRREARFSFLVGALTAGGTTLVLIVGGTMVVNGTITEGTLLLVLTYLGFIYGPLTAMSASTAVVREALASAERVHEVFRIAPEPVAAPPSAPVRRIRGAITFDRVSFAYTPGQTVLHEVSFEARSGELVAMVGPSGSGKTTVTSLLTRLYDPTSGRILIDGIDSQTYSLQELRLQIAVVVQEAVMLSGTVKENLRYGRLDATDAEVVQAATDAYAHEFIVQLPDGYDTELGAAGGRLSGGQRQRLSIARAFLKDAPILVLDEPTSALDTLSEARFIDALDRLRQRRTTFVVAHRLSTVRRADRILVLDGGRLVASGSHDELVVTCPLYARLSGEFADRAEADDERLLPHAAAS